MDEAPAAKELQAGYLLSVISLISVVFAPACGRTQVPLAVRADAGAVARAPTTPTLAPSTASPNQTVCSGACVDTDSDRLHCGSCSTL